MLCAAVLCIIIYTLLTHLPFACCCTCCCEQYKPKKDAKGLMRTAGATEFFRIMNEEIAVSKRQGLEQD